MLVFQNADSYVFVVKKEKYDYELIIDESSKRIWIRTFMNIGNSIDR